MVSLESFPDFLHCANVPLTADKYLQATFCTVNHSLSPSCMAEINIALIFIDNETIIKVNTKC